MFNRMADPNFRDDKGKKVTKLEDNLNPVQFNGFKSQKNKKLDEKQLKIARDLVKSAREGKLKDLTDGSTYFWNPQTSTSSWFRDNIANSDQYEQTTFDKVPKTKFEHIFYKLRPRLPNSPPEGRTPLALEEKEQTSFMGNAPPIGSLADEMQNLKASEQLEAATRNKAALQN